MEVERKAVKSDGRTGSFEEGIGTRGVTAFKGHIRRATLDDLEAIMDINDDVYEGFDYMPALFYRFMHSKLHELYVHEEDGKLTSLMNFCIDPIGEGFPSVLSGRVRNSHQGLGFGNVEKAPLVAQFLRDHPDVTGLAAAAILKPKLKSKLHRWKVFFISHCLMYKANDRPRLERFLKLTNIVSKFPQPVNLSYSRSIEWITESDQLVKFVSKYSPECMSLGPLWIPTRVNRSGLRDVFLENNVFVTFGQPLTSVNTKIEQTTEGEGREYELVGFSYSTILPCKYGVFTNVNFFGDDEDVFISHVRSHLLHYVSVTQSCVKIGCFLQFPQTIDLQSVETRLHEGLGSRVQSEHFCATQAVFYMTEKHLPHSRL